MQMLNQTVSIREVQRQYKDVVATVLQASQPVIVMNRSQAQLAMINLEQLEEYERLKLFSMLEAVRTNNQSVRLQEGLSDITAEVEVVRGSRWAQRITTKKNRTVETRFLLEEDVELLQQYINAISAEGTFIGFSGEQLSLGDEKEYVLSAIRDIKENNALHLVAVYEKRIVAVCDARRDVSLKKRSAHIAQLGLTVAKDFRGEGLGKEMMQQVIRLIPDHLPNIRLLKLGVFSENTVAVALYQQLGFVNYGDLPGGVLYKDKYIDHVFMYREI